MKIKIKKLITVWLILFMFIFALILFILQPPSIKKLIEQEDTTSKQDLDEILRVNPITAGPTNNLNNRIDPLVTDSTKSNEDNPDDRDDRILSTDITEAPPFIDRRLVRIFKGPTAGYRIDSVDREWFVKVVEQGIGNRFKISVLPYFITQVGGGELVKVQDADIFSNNSALLKYESIADESILDSAFVSFEVLGSSSSVQSFETNIRTATNNETLLFFTKRIRGETVGLVVDVSSPSDTRIVWKSGFSSWIPRWGRDKYISIQTPIAKETKGVIYLLKPDGNTDEILRPVEIENGGGVFFETASEYYVSYETDRNDFVGATYVKNKDTEIKIPTTLPEKCDGFNAVFVCAAPNRIPGETLSGYETHYPDSWYQGDLSLSDSIILIDPRRETIKVLLSPKQDDYKFLTNNIALDVIHPQISSDGRYFFFVNKSDLSLWALKLDS